MCEMVEGYNQCNKGMVKIDKERGENDAKGEMFALRQPGVALFPDTEAGKQVAAWLAGKMGLGLTADLKDFCMDQEGCIRSGRRMEEAYRRKSSAREAGTRWRR